MLHTCTCIAFIYMYVVPPQILMSVLKGLITAQELVIISVSIQLEALYVNVMKDINMGILKMLAQVIKHQCF